MIGPDGNGILPSVWEQCIEPGWFITMQLWKDREDAEKQAEEAFKKAVFDEAKAKAEEMFKKKALDEAKAKAEESSKRKVQAPIRFKDAVGRKFSFPFHLCQTWAVGLASLRCANVKTNYHGGYGSTCKAGIYTCRCYRASCTGRALRPHRTKWRNHPSAGVGKGDQT